MPVARLVAAGSDQAVPTTSHRGAPGGPTAFPLPHVSSRLPQCLRPRPAREDLWAGGGRDPVGSFASSLPARPRGKSLGPRTGSMTAGTPLSRATRRGTGRPWTAASAEDAVAVAPSDEGIYRPD